MEKKPAENGNYTHFQEKKGKKPFRLSAGGGNDGAGNEKRKKRGQAKIDSLFHPDARGTVEDTGLHRRNVDKIDNGNIKKLEKK